MPNTEDKDKDKDKKQTLQEKLDAIVFKNKQANVIKKMVNENKRLKEELGRKTKRKTSSNTKIAGLKTLGSKPSTPA
tara:strand:+ start:181 stop:411 length:231 start_codon:yes stop_codon:yes gene_type:complete